MDRSATPTSDKTPDATSEQGALREYAELWSWREQGRSLHDVDVVESLPQPNFRAGGRDYVSFSTNNYLGLATHPRMIAKAEEGLKRFGVGNCESRLLGGDLEIYTRLEEKLAALKKKEGAVIFATGYLTNLGVLSSIPKASQFARIYGYGSRQRHVYAYLSDEYNHTSIREGIQMSGVAKYAYRHRDMDHLESLLRKVEANTRIIVTDGVFSQDGDIAPLPDIIALADKYDAMIYMDDAHGTGVLGRDGSGTSEHFDVNSPRLIQMGTLSKAYGALGGFIAADSYIAEILRYTCSAYGFTSTLPPDQVLAISEAIDIVKDEPALRRRLWDNQKYFLSLMDRLPYRLMARTTPIVPVFIGDEQRCDRFAAVLKAEGFHVDAVKFPAVGLGQARLRVMLNAGHSREQIERLVNVFEANQALALA
ncbi:MAG: pyridoxal phosphate-dependent aminotransferase family protein [Parvibaculum sp.]|uniref:aminotransferase class I/II-fold pyridoxal phosphate-dependent enzyme n=1 Tax=Parvibaculum sp. TaxID=2024848 RepID=UPI0028401222|nr:pyridoxal phosphate-dependent aminotransferase family protein [Parvibaculum sp.]MDR3499855.1 pyridoxal phosphate-dependent aminotransferase family protein [Parvibaculum sp.]